MPKVRAATTDPTVMTTDRFGAAAAAEPAEPPAALGGLTALLWDERELLSSLQFKLVEQQLILRSGELLWAADADAEVRSTLRQLQDCEIVRAAELDELAMVYGLAADVTLDELAAHVPEPWPAILRDHHQALSVLTAAVDAVAAQTELLVRPGSSESAGDREPDGLT